MACSPFAWIAATVDAGVSMASMSHQAIGTLRSVAVGGALSWYW